MIRRLTSHAGHCERHQLGSQRLPRSIPCLPPSSLQVAAGAPLVRLLVVERSSRSASRQNLLANHRPTQNHRRSSRHTDHWHHLTLRDTDLPTLGQDIRPYRALVVRMQLTDGIVIPAGWRRFSRRSTRRRGRASFLAGSKPSGFAALQSGTAERVAAQRACEVDLQTLTNGSLALRAW